jgi:hypothetical protein
MKKILPLLIVGSFIVSGFGSTAFQVYNNEETLTEKRTFSTPQIDDLDHYVSISMNGANTCIKHPYKPVLPAYRKTFVFPFGTKIVDVVVSSSSQIQQKELSKPIMRAPQALPPEFTPSISEWDFQNNDDDSSNELYPDTWFDYTASCGLYKGVRSVLLTIVCYPVRYAKNMIYYIPSVEIKIIYEKPTKPVTLVSENYDLLIITPQEFSDALQPFVDYKESHGITTQLVTLEAIYDGTYFPAEGRDDAEQVKYFIKNALDEWGITYVLLVGGRKPGLTETWYTPVRYVHVVWGEETQYMSDLYFADIYDSEGNFSSWDTDDNDVFSEWPSMGMMKDEMDLYPDVYVGRWPCRNKLELKIIMQKTIRYENTQAERKVVVAGGDNFEEPGIEGEIVGDKTLALLPGFESAKVYATEMSVTAWNLKKALGDGAVFMHLHGHGSPVKWGTHPPENFDEWEDGLYITDIPWFFNKEYPITVIGGCHTAMFNVSLTNRPWIYTLRPTPEGIAWWFTRKIGGGGVASLGYTCFPVASPGEYGDLDGDGTNEPDCVESGYGYMQLQLFYAYGVEGMQHLGECWSYAMSRYLDVYKLPYSIWHLHTSQGFVLLGDPSLNIGGYQ